MSEYKEAGKKVIQHRLYHTCLSIIVLPAERMREHEEEAVCASAQRSESAQRRLQLQWEKNMMGGSLQHSK